MNSDLKLSSIGTGPRVLIVVGILIAGSVAVVGIGLQLGNAIALLSGPNDPTAPAAADLAIALAPSDPVGYWLKGTATGSLESLQEAVRHAPFDYRWRIELGRALENDEQYDAAELQFRGAVDLAPKYAFAHWSLANFLLRRERPDEAMAELRLAADGDNSYRDQAFSLVWEYFGRDTGRLEEFAGNDSEARARLAYFFATRGLATEALKNWEMLDEAQKASNPDILKAMAQGLFLQRHFKEALVFARQAGLDPDAQFETVSDGSFEKGLGGSGDSRFGWQVVRGDSKVEVSGDAKVKGDGNRSARMTFRNSVKPDFYNLVQTVAVEPNTRYRLRFWIRTENLRSAGMPLVAVVNANDDKPLAASKPFDSGTADWREVILDFATPAGCSGISIRTIRPGCGEECPIAGTLWYDDFRLERY
ncbi:MAG: tetratricopeptide repeat protein [Pyrinomonadaceae bacterium]|nr:tetratricopeptide repeat protein [Pyrinomonadaceae bacterium]